MVIPDKKQKGDFTMYILKKTMKVIGVMLVVFVAYILFQRPETASASEQNVSGTEIIWFDSSHSVTVDYLIRVTYGLDEGYTGWIIAMEPAREYGVGSNTVNIEQFSYAGDDAYGSSGYLKYYIWAHERWNNYTGYIYFKVTCDEWGNLSTEVWFESNC